MDTAVKLFGNMPLSFSSRSLFVSADDETAIQEYYVMLRIWVYLSYTAIFSANQEYLVSTRLDIAAQ
jgi:hypothetical protein